MPWLKLIQISCQKIQEVKDELFLVSVLGHEGRERSVESRVWGPIQIDNCEIRTIDIRYEFDKYVRLLLYEAEQIGLGVYMKNLMLTPRDIGRGEQRHRFSFIGGTYTLFFEVTDDEICLPKQTNN